MYRGCRDCRWRALQRVSLYLTTRPSISIRFLTRSPSSQLRVLLAEFRDPAAQSADSDLSDLPEMPDGVRDLTQIIREFRDEELEHKDTAVAHDAHAAPAYRLLGEIIKIGCKGAIWITNKV